MNDATYFATRKKCTKTLGSLGLYGVSTWNHYVGMFTLFILSCIFYIFQRRDTQATLYLLNSNIKMLQRN